MGCVVGFRAHCGGMRHRGLPHRGLDFGGINYLGSVDWTRLACVHHMREFDLLDIWRKRPSSLAGSDLNAVSRGTASRGCEIIAAKRTESMR
jgi:hypothetical protein